MAKPWYIDGFGAHYIELYAHRNDREAAQAVALLDRAGLDLKGLRLLDLACGAGRHMKALRRRGAEMIGLDLSPDLLEEAAKRAGSEREIILLRGDMRNVPLGDASVDGVLSMFTSFGYFPADKENWAVLDEVRRVLRPGGFYFLDFMNRDWVRRNLKAESERAGPRYRARERRRLEGDRVFKEVSVSEQAGGRELLRYEESVRLFSREDIVGAARQRGFEVRETWGSYTGRPFDVSESPRLILLFDGAAS